VQYPGMNEIYTLAPKIKRK